MALRSPEVRIPGTLFFVKLEDGKLIFMKHGRVERIEYVQDDVISIYKKMEDVLRKYNVFPGRNTLKEIAENLIKNYKVILEPKEIQLEKDKKAIEEKALELKVSQSIVFYVDDEKLDAILEELKVTDNLKKTLIDGYKSGMVFHTFSMFYDDQEVSLSLIFLNWTRLIDMARKVNLLVLMENMDDPATTTDLFEMIKELKSMNNNLIVILVGFTSEKDVRGIKLSVLRDFCKLYNVLYIENQDSLYNVLHEAYIIHSAGPEEKLQVIEGLQEKYLSMLSEPIEETVEKTSPEAEQPTEKQKEAPKKKKEKKKKKGFFSRFF